MASREPVDPLNIYTPIVDPKTGTPSMQFMRLWQQLFGNEEATAAVAEGAVPNTRVITAGAGLTGGGDLTVDRTLNVGAGTGVTVNADDVAIDTVAEAERIRDVIGAALVAGANITITVNDAGDTITIAASGGGGGGAPKSAAGIAAIFPTLGNAPTLTEVNGKGLYMTGAVASLQLRYAVKALPTADTTVIAYVRGSLGANYNSIGLIIRDSTSGRSITNTMTHNNGPTVDALLMNSDTSLSSGIAVTGEEQLDRHWLRLRYIHATKTVNYDVSADGVTWRNFVSNSVWLAAPDQMGVVYGCRNGSVQGGGFIMYYNDGVSSFDFDPDVVYS